MKRRKDRKGTGRRTRREPLIRLVGLDAALATAGLAAGTALAAPGELDPSFGDVGRQSTIEATFWTTDQSIDVADDDSLLYGAGGEYCSYYYACYEGSFFGALRSDGSPDPGYLPAVAAGMIVADTVRQPDGKLIGIGRTRIPGGGLAVQIFRLLPNGALDTGFGLAGYATISNGTSTAALAVSGSLDPDGKLVVAGFRYPDLFVARFRADGTLDPAFGTAGIYSATPPANGYLGNPARVRRSATGGYRVLVHQGGDGTTNGCSVRALTATGTLDTTFGQGGVAPAAAPAGAVGPVVCESMALQADGKAVLAGTYGTNGPSAAYLGRQLANGSPDTAFDAGAAAARMSRVKVAAVGADGSILLAGESTSGFTASLVTRLRPDGSIDQAYGRNGTTRIDLAAERTAYARIGDLTVLPDGRVVVAGTAVVDSGVRLFVARLLGAAGAGAGVLGIKESFTLRREQAGSVPLTVERTGGRSGATAVTYTTRALQGTGSASAGVDFTAVTGRLTWADGDDGERQIVIPLLADSEDEAPEQFEVVLSAPEGGAGLAATGGTVEIADFGYPAGALNVSSSPGTAAEGSYTTLVVRRDNYGEGPASVTVRAVAGGTATAGTDFVNRRGDQAWRDVVVSWGAGDRNPQTVLVYLQTDLAAEPSETVTFELVAPGGGAVLGPQARAEVTILNTVPESGGGGGGGAGGNTGGGGGGSWGGLGALLLGLAGIVRRRRMQAP